MGQFSYIAVDRAGKKTKGMMEAPNEVEARVMLRSQGLRPLRLGKAGALALDMNNLQLWGAGRVAETDMLLFTRQLSILVASGVPLVQGLDAIVSQLPAGTMRRTVLAIKEKVTSGSFLWEAMKPYNKIFPDIYVSLVKAGEASGSLDAVFKRLTKYLEDSYKLKKLVKGAMIYPVSIFTVGIGVMVIMMVYVIPKFEVLLKSAGQELPGPTQFVLDLSHFFQNNFLFIIAGAVALVYGFKTFAASTEGRRFLDHNLLKVPVFGPIALKAAIARFTRTLQTLLTSGVNLLDSLEICRDVIGNYTMADLISRMRVEIEAGKTLGSVISKMPLIPIMVTQMITIGESTGNLDRMLERIADFYEDEIQQIVQNIGKLIEPFILVFLGGMVGGLMIAMYLPIFKMAGAA